MSFGVTFCEELGAPFSIELYNALGDVLGDAISDELCDPLGEELYVSF